MTDREMHTYDQMVERGIATAEELNLVKAVMPGTWQEILDSVMYARTGYGTFEDCLWDEDEDSADWDL